MKLEELKKFCKMTGVECAKETEKYNEGLKKGQEELVFEVLQCSDLAKKPEIIYQIAKFYDENWTGNKDFMHIPDIEQTAKKCI